MKIGKAISQILLKRTVPWKLKVHERGDQLSARMLMPGNFVLTENCLLCNTLTSAYATLSGVPYGLCDNCNHLQAIKRPTSDFLYSLYSSTVEEEYSPQDLAYVRLSQLDLAARINEIAAPKVQFIRDNINFHAGDLWIDIGSGTGDVLVCARNLGFDILGVEISSSEISLAESRLVPTVPIFYDGNQTLPRIDSVKVVSLFNVLEHTLNPLNFLASIVDQMPSKAFIVIEVPRLNSISSIIQAGSSTKVYRHINPPEHINIFSDKSISILLQKLSLEYITTWYFGSDAITLFDYILELTQPNFTGSLELFSSEINLLQNQIDSANLSDVLLLIARKK